MDTPISDTNDTSDTSDTSNTQDKVGLKGEPKKRLFDSAASKLSRFANTKAKRHRSNALNSSYPTLERKNNPFSVASQSLPSHVTIEVDSSMDLSHEHADDTDGAGNMDEELSSVAETPSKFSSFHTSSMKDEPLDSYSERDQGVVTPPTGRFNGEVSESYSFSTMDREVTPPTRSNQPWDHKSFNITVGH